MVEGDFGSSLYLSLRPHVSLRRKQRHLGGSCLGENPQAEPVRFAAYDARINLSWIVYHLFSSNGQ